ncbi:prolyl-tRNA synthetase [Candidatus Saccharibacteria bacterium]|nr:prolyl-tRNA synthetase [Candidatus Saccharibacteria bacterium]
MKLSHSFTKTLRDAPKDESARSAQYLIRAGFVHKELAGVYDYLPLGLRTLNKVENIIREELDKIGCEEVRMSALQSPDTWKKTGRWSDQKVDIWFKTELSAGGELGLAPTHEEPMTNMLKTYIKSYKDLPLYVYQFQTKFRNELRAKSGIMRTREFLMKDLYSFSADEDSHNNFYHKVEDAYKTIYQRVGLGDCTYQTFASGGIFSKFSHEFQTEIPVGEDTIYYNKDKSIVLNEEVKLPEVLEELGVQEEDLESTRAAEVGNIFTLKYKYSEPLGLTFNDQAGKEQTVFMGCYGIGVSRVMGVVAEKYADDKGLVWPEEIAPYYMYIIPIGEEGTKIATELEAQFPDLILLDDRNMRPGEKFADADLMGIPHRIVISDKTLAEEKVEQTYRQTGEQKLLTLNDLTAILSGYEKDH